MNPHQTNKVDINSLSPEEQRLFRLYGKLPTKKDLLQNKLKERKYFDSGDYALSKAGRGEDTVGSCHPVPEQIPHPALNVSHSVPKDAHHANSPPTPGGKEQDQLPGSFCGHPPSVGFHRKSSLSESADSEGEETNGAESKEEASLPKTEGETGEQKKDEVNPPSVGFHHKSSLSESGEETKGEETNGAESKEEASLPKTEGETEGKTGEQKKSLDREEVPIQR